MDLAELSGLAARLDGVRRSSVDGVVEWRYKGRIVARDLGGGRVVFRCGFDRRDALLRAFPGTFSAPGRYARHMMVVADLAHGDPGAIEHALEEAWLLQRRQ